MSLFGPPNVPKLESKRDIKGLIGALNYTATPDFHQIRLSATEALIRIGEAAVEHLIVALKNTRSTSQVPLSVAVFAARALGRIGDGRAVEPLIAALKESDQLLFDNLTLALGQIGDKRAVEPLIATFKRNNLDTTSSIVALGQIGDPLAVEPLMGLVNNRNLGKNPGGVVEEVGRALDRIGWQPDISDKSEVAAAYWIAKAEWDKCVEIGKLAVQPLIDFFKRRNNNNAPIRALGEIGDPSAVDYLIETLKYFPHGGGVDSFLLLRRDAAVALGQIGDPRAIEPLIAALDDRENIVRINADLALKKIRPKGEHIALYAYIIQGPSPEALQMSAHVMIMTSSDEEVIEKIRGQAKSPDAEVMLISPEDWNPPKLEAVSEETVNAKAAQITSRIQAHMASAHLPRMEAQEILAQSFYLVKPMSGKVFFVVKVRAPAKTKAKARKAVPQPSDNPMALYGEMSSGLDKHIARLKAYFREQGRSGEITKLVEELGSDPFLSFARNTFSKLAERVLEENTIHSDTDALGSWFTAVTVCPVVNPVEVQAYLPGGYLALFDQLTKPFQGGGKHIAHWIICTDGVGAGVHLTLIPDPNIARGVVPVIAVDLLNSAERTALKL